LIPNWKKEETDMIDQFYSDPLSLQRLRFGPLGTHIDTFAELLSAQGYARSTAKEKIRVVAGLSCWLHRRRLGVETLDEQRVSEFLRYWRHQGLYGRGTFCTLQELLRHLREAGIARFVPSVEKNAFHGIERDFARYLTQERGLAQATLDNYLPTARTFLSECFGEGPLALNELDPKDITRFIVRHSKAVSRRRLQLVVTALRSFFRFLYQRGEIATDLAASVPKVANGRLSDLPKFLEPEQVERVLKACREDIPVGQRDYAILLLLARLGLRAGEVVHLELEDLDWEKGRIRVRGKSVREDWLPIPQDVGKGLARYLLHGRPRCPSRRVFLRLKAPRQGFTSSAAICDVVRRAITRAGLPLTRKGSHLLRHSLAIQMLRGGATLLEIGEILRHQLPSTTEIYAKVNVAALRALALPWKGGVR
jgi:site-specific recombinase XerD